MRGNFYAFIGGLRGPDSALLQIEERVIGLIPQRPVNALAAHKKKKRRDPFRAVQSRPGHLAGRMGTVHPRPNRFVYYPA